MAVELSGDTGAAMWSYIHVQSVQSNTTCHNNYDRTIKTFFFPVGGDSLCPTSVPLDWPWYLAKSLSFLTTSLLGGTKQFPSPVFFPLGSPLKGVHAICA